MRMTSVTELRVGYLSLGCLAATVLWSSPAVARGGGGCIPGSGNCLTLSGSHPAGQLMGLLMGVCIVGILAAILGSVLAFQGKKHSETRSISALIAVWKDPSVDRLLKLMMLGGVGTFIVAFVLMGIVMNLFGTRS